MTVQELIDDLLTVKDKKYLLLMEECFNINILRILMYN
jgi:hypothetical protein